MDTSAIVLSLQRDEIAGLVRAELTLRTYGRPARCMLSCDRQLNLGDDDRQLIVDQLIGLADVQLARFGHSALLL